MFAQADKGTQREFSGRLDHATVAHDRTNTLAGPLIGRTVAGPESLGFPDRPIGPGSGYSVANVKRGSAART